MNTHLTSLLDVARCYAQHQGLSISHVSKLSTGGGKVLDNIYSGADMTTGRLLTTMRWFSTNWPDGLDWPSDIDRPEIPGPAGTEAPDAGVSSLNSAAGDGADARADAPAGGVFTDGEAA